MLKGLRNAIFEKTQFDVYDIQQRCMYAMPLAIRRPDGLLHNPNMSPGKYHAPRTGRLFLAIWPDDEVRSQLIAHVNQWQWSLQSVRYAPTDWHTTLHFIGSVDIDRLGQIADQVLVPFEPFYMLMDRPAIWQRGLAVLCAGETPAPLVMLWAQLGDQLNRLGIAPEQRPYQPHVTLARHAQGAIPPPAVEPVGWPVRQYALAVSTGAGAQRYVVLREYLRQR